MIKEEKYLLMALEDQTKLVEFNSYAKTECSFETSRDKFSIAAFFFYILIRKTFSRSIKMQ